MGREIIRQESHDAGERSRLWHHEDAFNVLKNEMGTKTVEGLTLDMRMLNDVGNNAKKRRYEELRDKSILSKHVSSLKRRCFSLISGQSVSTTLTSPNDIYLRTDAFKNMTKLRLLQLNYVQLTGSYENFPKSLVWLSWHGFPLKSIPVEFSLENLVALHLLHSILEQVWKETPFLGSLKILDLSYSERLARTPNFLGLPNLKRLILKSCVSLVEVCESIGNLELLDLLDLEDCKTLRKLPRNIGKLESLKTLVILGCNIVEWPSEMINMESLQVLNADGIIINPLHSSSWKVKWWQPIVWSFLATPTKGLETLWASLPFSLRELSLSGCKLSDDSFPENFGNLPLLSWLNLSANPFHRLPNCIKSLSGLNFLGLYKCHWLQSLELNGLSMKSGWIDAGNCRSLEKIMSPNGSINLFLHGCYKLVELEDCFMKEDYDRENRVKNKTKDLTWIYGPTYFPYDEYMRWLSRWRFGNQLEVGDNIIITFDGKDRYLVKECGFKIVYHSDEEEEHNGNSSSSSIVEESSHHDFQALRLSTGEYFLCKRFEENPDQNLWFPQ
ncbi:hypothetical protein LguiA_007540 [Lonicera macranthoides]